LSQKLDELKIATMYNNMKDIWPSNDKWYSYTHNVLIKSTIKYTNINTFNNQSLILNVGSAGNEYGIPGIHYHIDIAEDKLNGVENAYITSAERLPFNDEMFDGGLCVGSVINYCDPFAVIGEISRTLKSGAFFIFDFEQSNSWQFIGNKSYKADASIISSFNSGIKDDVWVFSYKHIKSILNTYNFIIKDKLYFHLISPLFYRIYKDEQKAAKYSKLDSIIRVFPIINKKSCNIILIIQKV
jgi:ubiquinone/menaquinone biosynthesis C-methylase UbiE